MKILRKNVAISQMEDSDGRLDVVLQDPERRKYPIRLWRGEGVKQLPDPEWILKNFITRGGLTIVFGPPGSGKSLMMLDWAQHIQLGKDWNEKHTTHQGNVLYVMAEGQFGLKGRLEAWQIQHQQDDLPPVAYHIEGVSFWAPPGKENDAAEAIVLAAEALNVDVVMIDTMAATFGGGNENQAQDMNQYLKPLRELRQMGVSVVISHHVNKSDRSIRGSTVLAGEADTLVEMRPTMDKANPGQMKWVTVVCQKQKDYVPFVPFRMHLESVELESYGDYDRSGPVLIPADVYGLTSTDDRRYNPTVRQEQMKKDMTAYIANNPHASWRDIRESVKGKSTELAEVRNILETMGVIEDDGVGWILGPVAIEHTEDAEVPPLLGYREEE